jgi:hypothetical protein
MLFAKVYAVGFVLSCIVGAIEMKRTSRKLSRWWPVVAAFSALLWWLVLPGLVAGWFLNASEGRWRSQASAEPEHWKRA